MWIVSGPMWKLDQLRSGLGMLRCTPDIMCLPGMSWPGGLGVPFRGDRTARRRPQHAGSGPDAAACRSASLAVRVGNGRSTDARGGGGERRDQSARAGGVAVSCWGCRDRRISIRERSSACTRWRRSPPTSGRTRPSSAPTRSSTDVTDAAYRCRGPARAPRSASVRGVRTCRSRRGSRTRRSRRRRAIRHPLSRSTAVPSPCGTSSWRWSDWSGSRPAAAMCCVSAARMAGRW